VTASGSRLRTFQVIAAESALVLGSATGLLSSPAVAETWRLTPSVNVRETYTSNANLAPSGQAQSSFVTTLGAGLGVAGNGARVQLNGFVGVSGNYYAGEYDRNSSSQNIFVRANLLGNVEAIENFFFIEGAVNVSQSYLSPFGPTPASNIGVTDNRYTSVGFRLSPYIRGVFPGGTTYLLRSDSIWSNLGQVQNAPGSTSSFTQVWSGRLDSPIRTFGWSADASATRTSFSAQERDTSSEIVRGYLNWRPDPQVLVYAIGGYEWNNYYLTQSDNIVYGAGGEWRPTERTLVKGNWQERFFGSSYLAQVTHRNPFTAFDVNASRNISTYPQQLFAAPAGGDLAALLNATFITRIPDPVQRAQAVQQFLATSGLPSSLQSPLNYYIQQVILYEQQSATFTLLGVRNSTAFTVYNRKQEAISGGTGAALPPQLAFGQNNTQRGGAITYSHQLTPLTNLNATATRYQTTATAPLTARSTTNAFLLSAGTRLGPKTDGVTGLTYTDFDSDVTNDYTAFTVYVGLNHRF
jgi:uncharacterized protein (PEP-CTERM system associated)